MSELNLPSLGTRQNVRDQIAQALRASLVAGEMRPGVVYSAPTLAERFGVSPTPVREAMLDLAREHLQLLDFVTGGDVVAAETLMRHHLRHVRGIWATPPGPPGTVGQ